MQVLPTGPIRAVGRSMHGWPARGPCRQSRSDLCCFLTQSRICHCGPVVHAPALGKLEPVVASASARHMHSGGSDRTRRSLSDSAERRRPARASRRYSILRRTMWEWNAPGANGPWCHQAQRQNRRAAMSFERSSRSQHHVGPTGRAERAETLTDLPQRSATARRAGACVSGP